MNYYETLGVPKGASDQEIKAAYRKQALEWHPDRNKDPKASAKFKEVTEAYEVLSNPQKKQSYDQFGSADNGQQSPFSYTYRTYGSEGGQDFGGFNDPFEIFEQFFGGGFSNGGGQRRTRRQIYSLGLTFMEAVKGVEKTVNIGGKQMKIKIPAGVDSGQRVRFGEFDIQITVSPDSRFQRQGLDLFVESDVSFPDAVLGTTIEVPTIDGVVSLKVPPATAPDSLIRLREKGIKSPQSNRVGNQYVKIKVTMPNKLTNDQKRLLEEFRNSLDNKKRSGWF